MTKYEFLGDLSRLLSDLPEEERDQALLYYEDYFADAGPENEQQVIEELQSPEAVAALIKEESEENILYGEGDLSEKGEYPLPKRNRGFQEERQGTDERQNSYSGGSMAGSTSYQTDGDSFSHFRERLISFFHEKTVWAVIIVTLIITVGIPTGIPVILGILGALLGIILGLLAGGVSVFLAGAGFLVGGITNFLWNGPTGVLMIGIGLLLFGIGILLFYGGICFCTKVIPALYQACVRVWNNLFHKNGGAV